MAMNWISFRSNGGGSTKSTTSQQNTELPGSLVNRAPSFYQSTGQSRSFRNVIKQLSENFKSSSDKKGKRNKTKVIFNWPMPRQEWVNGKFVEHHEKNDEAWVELFIDLIYVVLLSSLSNQLEIGHASVELFFKVALSFWIICLTRQAIDEYSNRFYCHDFVQKCIYFVYTIAVLIQAIAIQFDYLRQLGHVEADDAAIHLVEEDDAAHAVDDATHHSVASYVAAGYLHLASNVEHASSSSGGASHPATYSSAFALSLLITRVCLLFIYALVMKKHKDARAQFMFDMIRWMGTSCLMAALIIINIFGRGSNVTDISFFAAVVVLELSLWVISRTLYRQYFKFPVNLETLQARWGVWVMIVIGEAVIQLLHSFHSAGELINTLIFMGFSLLLLFALAMQYFDACQVEWYEHALTKSAIAGVSWIWLHVSMTHYLFRLGIWLKALSDAFSQVGGISGGQGADITSIGRSFSVSLGVVSCLMTIIRMSNSLPDSSASFVSTIYNSEARSAMTLFFRLVLSSLQFALGFVGIRNPLYLLLAQVAVALVTTGLDVVNEIHDTALRMKEEEAKAKHHSAIKSLKQFPRQWSRLQLVKKESLLQMNLMSEDGGSASSAVASSKSRSGGGDESPLQLHVNYGHHNRSNLHLLKSQNSSDSSVNLHGDDTYRSPFKGNNSNNLHVETGTAGDYGTDISPVVEIDLKSVVERQLLKQERVAHFDAGYNSSNHSAVHKNWPSFGTLFRATQARIQPLSTLKESLKEQSRRAISSSSCDSPMGSGRPGSTPMMNTSGHGSVAVLLAPKGSHAFGMFSRSSENGNRSGSPSPGGGVGADVVAVGALMRDNSNHSQQSNGGGAEGKASRSSSNESTPGGHGHFGYVKPHSHPTKGSNDAVSRFDADDVLMHHGCSPLMTTNRKLFNNVDSATCMNRNMDMDMDMIADMAVVAEDFYEDSNKTMKYNSLHKNGFGDDGEDHEESVTAPGSTALFRSSNTPITGAGDSTETLLERCDAPASAASLATRQSVQLQLWLQQHHNIEDVVYNNA